MNPSDVIVEEEDMEQSVSDQMSALKRIRDVRLGIQNTFINSERNVKSTSK